MKKISIKTEKEFSAVKGKELRALGFTEGYGASLFKCYPSKRDGYKYVGYVTFEFIPDAEEDVYYDKYGFISLSCFGIEDDQKKFQKMLKQTIDEYRSDMMKLGLLEEKK